MVQRTRSSDITYVSSLECSSARPCRFLSAPSCIAGQNRPGSPRVHRNLRRRLTLTGLDHALGGCHDPTLPRPQNGPNLLDARDAVSKTNGHKAIGSVQHLWTPPSGQGETSGLSWRVVGCCHLSGL